MTTRKADIWAAWIRHRRSGGDPELEAKTMEQLAKTRDRVLDNAQLRPGETLLDVGCGNGLIGLGALERGAGRVLFTDISQDLLDDARAVAEELLLLDRCEFVQARAEDLWVVPAESVDVVTTRSVLIYVEDKARAFTEFFRVLRPGGRVSLFEPVNRLNRFRKAYELEAVKELDDKLQALFDRIQPPDSDPMLTFDDRDLVDLTEGAGFDEIRLTLEVEVRPPDPMRWETFLDVAWNPKLPTLAEAMEQVFTPEERDAYVAVLRPLVEGGRGSRRMATSFLWAVKR
jgi:arsenite methyltransferase